MSDPYFDKKKEEYLVDFICMYCRKSVTRPLNLVKRNNKRGYTRFCSRKCSDSYLNLRGTYKNRPKDHRSEYWTPFYKLFYEARRRSIDKGWKIDVDPAFLESIYLKQKKKCSISGIELDLYAETNTPYRVSIDRIDSSEGYTKKNIQLVVCMANYAKSIWDVEEIYKFSKSVVDFHGL